MKPNLWIVALLALGLPVTPALADINVKFVESDRYTDVGPFQDRANTLVDLERVLKQLGNRYVPAGQVLQLEILDVDLAGRMEPARGAAPDVRVLRGGADWPRIRLQYTLKAGDKVVRQGKDDVADMSYLSHPPMANRNESLAYEKRMLDEWFRAKIAAAPKRAP